MDDLPAARLLASNIMRLRGERGWTQDDLADRMGGVFQSVSKLENVRVNPTLRTISNVAAAFDVPIAELFRE